MTPQAIDWAALGNVAIVTIVATVIIASLMSAANWCFSEDGMVDGVIPLGKKIGGFAILTVMGLIVLFGIYLIVPYFR
ncbi:MAG: hypothetical protein LBM23_09240 [Propionibacteriaceae bacterium]|jgi:hypothetical protein|nr:hypothetical protein [Propionibacteriaceae bacterium]